MHLSVRGTIWAENAAAGFERPAMRKNNLKASRQSSNASANSGRKNAKTLLARSLSRSTRVDSARKTRTNGSAAPTTSRKNTTWIEYLKHHPDLARRFDEAIKASTSDRLRLAISTLKKLAREHPNQGPLHWYLGAVLHYQADKPGQALQHFQRAVELNPKSARASKGLFHCLWDLDRVDEALREIKRFQVITSWTCKDYVEIVQELHDKWVNLPEKPKLSRKTGS